MRCHYISDLHLEREAKTANGYASNFNPPRNAGDVAILAGDIAASDDVLDWIAKNFDIPVIFVPGNHEFYDTEFLSAQSRISKAALKNIHVLNPGTVIVNGVRFVGATLWTDYRLHGEQMKSQMIAISAVNDHKDIRYDAEDGARTLLPTDVAAIHIDERRYIEDQLAISFDGPTVVVTHHLPTPESIQGHRSEGDFAPAYASDLRNLIAAYAPTVWVHGHVHNNVDQRFADTRIFCNPRGYWPDMLNPEFNINATFEV